MDVEGDAAGASALQQFTLLAKSAKGAACASLISQALDHPSIYVFGELLDTDSVKQVRWAPPPRPTPCATRDTARSVAACDGERGA